jgi:hypothetical protein
MLRPQCASPCWRRRVRSFVLCGLLALLRTRLLHIAEVYQAKDGGFCGGSDTLTTSCPTVPRAPVMAIFILLIRGAVDCVVFDLVRNPGRFSKDWKCEMKLFSCGFRICIFTIHRLSGDVTMRCCKGFICQRNARVIHHRIWPIWLFSV